MLLEDDAKVSAVSASHTVLSRALRRVIQTIADATAAFNCLNLVVCSASLHAVLTDAAVTVRQAPRSPPLRDDNLTGLSRDGDRVSSLRADWHPKGSWTVAIHLPMRFRIRRAGWSAV
jgi:hypothetical protein